MAGRLLKRLNTNAITLVPKCPYSSKITDFRPISCCNLIYKCISKILANIIKRCLPPIISENQCAFIEGRRIIDNILLAQEVVKDYNQARGKPRCSLMLDIKKAFDSVRWSFLLVVMEAMGCPPKFLNWITECITSPMFSVKINGELEVFFNGEKGLRYGTLYPLICLLSVWRY